MANTPKRIQYNDTDFTTTGASKTSATITWQAQDVIVVISASENTTTFGTPVCTGLTFTLQKFNSTAGFCNTAVYTARPSAAGSATVAQTSSASTLRWAFAVWVYRGTNGVGASSEQHTTTKTVGLTPLAVTTNSSVVWGAFDFSAAATTGATLTPVATNTTGLAQVAGAYSFFVGDLTQQTSTSSVPYGVTGGSSTGTFSIVALEIMGIGSLANNYQFVKVGDGMSTSERIR